MRKDNSFNSLLVETMKRHKREVIIGAAVVCALIGCILLILCAPSSPQSAHAASEVVGTDLAVVSQAQAQAGDDMTRRMQEIYDYLVQLDGMVTDNQSTLEAVRTQTGFDVTEDESVSVIKEQLQGDVMNLSERMLTIHDELTETKKMIETVNEAVEGGGTLSDEKTKSSFTEITRSIETVSNDLNTSVSEIKKLVEALQTSDLESNKSVIDTLNSVKSSIEKAQTKSFSSVTEELENIRSSYMAALENIQSKINGSFGNLGIAVEKIGSDLNGVSGSVSKVGEGVDTVNSNLNKTRDDVSAVSGSISQVGESVNTVKSSVDKARDDVNDVGTNVTKARQDVADVDINVKKVGQDVTGVSSSLSKAIDDVASVNSNVNEAKKAVDGVNTNVDKAIEGVAGVNDNVNRVGANIDTISGNVDKLGTDVGTLAGSLDNVKTELGDQVSGVSQGMTALEGKTDELKDQVNGVQGNINGKIESLDSSIGTRLDAINGRLDGLFQYVSNGKQKLAAALLTKNVVVDPATSWDQFKAAIESIQQVFVINGNEVPANAVYEYHKHSTNPGDTVSWSIEGPEDMSTSPAEVSNDVAVGPEYQGGCFTTPIYHMHGDDCDRRVTSVTVDIATESWHEISSVGQCITCGNVGYTYRYDAILNVTTKITHPKEADQISVEQKEYTVGKIASGGRTGYKCEDCVKRDVAAGMSRLEYETSELACYLDGAVIGYREDCPYVKGQVVRAHLTFPGG